MLSWMPSIVRREMMCALLLLAGMMVPGARAGEADDQFAVAAGHYGQQRWRLAAEEFATFLSEHAAHPKAAEAFFYLAEARLQTGKLAEAEAGFREYLACSPDGRFARSALFRAGEAAYLGGKGDAAQADLERFRAAYPHDKLNAYVLPYLGDLALDRHEAAEAAGLFRAGLERFPQGPLQDDCRFGLARSLERLEQTDEAERLYMAIAAKRGSRLADDAQFHLGALQYATGEYSAAIETFGAFGAQFADSRWRSNARLGTGWALLKLDRPAEAEPCFAALVTDPEIGLDARYWLGLTQKIRQDWPTAAATLSAAAADAAAGGHSLTGALRVHAGNALLRADDPAAAGRQFDLVLADETTDAAWLDDALCGAVEVALRTGNHAAVDARSAELDERFASSPLRADVLRMRAQSLIQRGDSTGAIGLLEPLVSSGAARNMEDRYLLALAYQYADRPDDALAAVLPVVDAAEGPLRNDARLLQGSLLVAIEKYHEAIEPLEACLAADVGSAHRPTAEGKLAVCLAHCGQWDRAKQVFEALVEGHSADPGILAVTERLADVAYEAGDVAWSTALYGRLLAEPPETGDRGLVSRALAGLAWSQLKAGSTAEAADTFGKLLRADPPAALAAEAALVRGRLLEQLDQPDLALTLYDRVIDAYPQREEHPEALWAAARLRDRLEQNREAAALYERLATEYASRPDTDGVLYQWAWVLDELGQADASRARFEQVRREHPESRYAADAAYRLAREALAAKDYVMADVLAREALAGSADPAIREHALYLRGQIASEREQWERVGDHFASLAEQFPESANRAVADCWVAEAAYRLRDFETAERLFDKLAEETAGRRDGWLAIVALRRAQVLAQRDAWDEALRIATAIATDFPDFEQQYEVDYLVGRCHANRADFDGARLYYRKAIASADGAKTETAAMAQWMIGESYYHQKDYEAALREYLKVEILYAYPTWQAASLLQAGKCQSQLGEAAEALRLFAKLLKEHPDSPFAVEAEHLAGGIRGVETVGARPD